MPIKRDLLDAVTTVVTHDNCPDGLASALILHDALPHARILFAQYGTPELLDLPAEPGMLFCDITPAHERADAFVAAGAIVLDHHKTARKVVESFGERGVFADEAAEPGVSGALLAFRSVWDHLVPEGATDRSRRDAVSRLAVLAGVRDTWQRHDARWDVACAQAEALMLWPREKWLELGPAGWERFLEIGPTMLQKQAERVKRGIAKAWRHTVAGLRVVVLDGVDVVSDAAESLGAEADLVVGFAYRAREGSNLELVFSLRSHADFDCSAFAKLHGGGGHTRAAGFGLPADPFADGTPYTVLLQRLEAYVLAHGSRSTPH